MELILKITMADPAGNRTAFVEGDVSPEQYAAVGSALLNDPELKAEQAGFLCPPRLDTIGRLQMMGGEFCGNAARSFGLMMGLRAGKQAGDTVPIEISGSSTVLEVLIEEKGAWVSMPLPQRIEEIQLPAVYGMDISASQTPDGMLHYPAVILEGITHVILEQVKPSEPLARAVIEKAAKLTGADAAGAIFLDGRHMTPAVWVRDTNSFVWESSCGSGTLAATVWLGRDIQDGDYNLELSQPGGILKAGITVREGMIIKAQIGGPVSFEEPVFKTVRL